MNWLAQFQPYYVDHVYATHGKSHAIRRALSECLRVLDSGGCGLNVGAGSTRIHPRILNVDLHPASGVAVCADAVALPFVNGAFSVVVSQETLEHVRDPRTAVMEMHRVLKDGGVRYCQAPFIIGYHPGPSDFARWTREGLVALLQSAGFACEHANIVVGPATGSFRVAVEFWAVLLSCFHPSLYKPVKGVAALLLSPLKLLDGIMVRSKQADRIAGGFYVIARKTCQQPAH